MGVDRDAAGAADLRAAAPRGPDHELELAAGAEHLHPAAAGVGHGDPPGMGVDRDAVGQEELPVADPGRPDRQGGRAVGAEQPHAVVSPVGDRDRPCGAERHAGRRLEPRVSAAAPLRPELHLERGAAVRRPGGAGVAGGHFHRPGHPRVEHAVVRVRSRRGERARERAPWLHQAAVERAARRAGRPAGRGVGRRVQVRPPHLPAGGDGDAGGDKAPGGRLAPRDGRALRHGDVGHGVVGERGARGGGCGGSSNGGQRRGAAKRLRPRPCVHAGATRRAHYNLGMQASPAADGRRPPCSGGRSACVGRGARGPAWQPAPAPVPAAPAMRTSRTPGLSAGIRRGIAPARSVAAAASARWPVL